MATPLTQQEIEALRKVLVPPPSPFPAAGWTEEDFQKFIVGKDKEDLNKYYRDIISRELGQEPEQVETIVEFPEEEFSLVAPESIRSLEEPPEAAIFDYPMAQDVRDQARKTEEAYKQIAETEAIDTQTLKKEEQEIERLYVEDKLPEEEFFKYSAAFDNMISKRIGKKKDKIDSVMDEYRISLHPDLKAIPYVMVINPKGKFINLEDLHPDNIDDIAETAVLPPISNPEKYKKDLKRQADLQFMMRVAYGKPKGKDEFYLYEDINKAYDILDKERNNLEAKDIDDLDRRLNLNRILLEKQIKISEKGIKEVTREEYATTGKAYESRARSKQYKELRGLRNKKNRLKNLFTKKHIRQGMDPEKARQEATKKVDALMPSMSMNYYEEPKIGRSMIRGDLGQFIWDKDAQEYRKATSLEKVSGAFSRQPIGSFRSQLKNSLNRSLRELHKEPKKEKVEDPFSITESLKRQAAGALRNVLPALLPEYGVGVEEGIVFESPFMKNLRLLETMVAAATPLMQATLGQDLYDELKEEGSISHKGETEQKYKYKVSPSDEYLDQFALNLSNSQFFPEYFEATMGDTIGKRAAWWWGLVQSMFIPITPVPVVSRTVEGIGVGGRALGALETGQKLIDISKPLARLASYNRVERIRDAFDEVIPEGELRELTKVQAEADKFEKKEFKDFILRRTRHNTLPEIVLDNISSRISDYTVMKGVIDANGDIVSQLGKMEKTPTVVKWIKNPRPIVKNVNKFWDDFAAKAKTDPLTGRQYTRANEVRSQIKNRSRIIESQEEAPFLAPATRLDKSLRDNLFYVMAEHMPDNELLEVFQKISRLPKEKRTGSEMAKALKNKDLVPWNATDGQLQQALKMTLKDVSREDVLHYMPYKDVVRLDGDVYQRSGIVNDPKRLEAFRKDVASLLGEESYTLVKDENFLAKVNELPFIQRIQVINRLDNQMNDVAHVIIKNPEDIKKVLTQEIGISNMTGSSFYIDLFRRLDEGKPVSLLEWDAIKNLTFRSLNKKHFDAFELTDLGRQVERAMSPMAGILPTSRGIYETPSALKFSPVQLLRSLKRKPVDWLRSSKGDVKTGRLIKSIEDQFTKIEDGMNREVADNYKRLVNDGVKRDVASVMAVDETAVRTWENEMIFLNKSREDMVDRSFDGSYRKAVQAGFFTKKGSGKGESLEMNITSAVRSEAKQLNIPMDSPQIESLYRKHANDFANFLEKRNVWESIFERYFDESIKGMQDIGVKDRLMDMTYKNWPGKEASRYTSKASNVLDPTLSNVKLYFDRVIASTNKEPKLMTAFQGLKKKAGEIAPKKISSLFKPKTAITQALIPWMLGARKSQVVKKEIYEYALLNPTRVVPTMTNPLSGSLSLDPYPLYNHYSKLYRSLFQSDTSEVVPFIDNPTALISLPDAEGTFVRRMTQAHLDALKRVNWKIRSKMLSDEGRLMVSQETIDPDRSGMINTMKKHVQEALTPVTKELEGLLGGLDQEIKDKAIRNLETFLLSPEKEYTKLNTVTGQPNVFESTPYMSGQQYMLLGHLDRSMLDLIKSNGGKIGNEYELLKNVDSYKPLFNNSFIVREEGALSKMINNLSEAQAKYSSGVDKLLNADASGWELAAKNLGQLIDGATRVVASGLLGGWLLPGLRYLGINILTAPLIATVAADRHGLGVLNPFNVANTWKSMRKTLPSRNPNDVLFVTKRGKVYKAGEVERLMNTHNRGFSEEGLIYHTQMGEEMMRQVGLTISGMPKGRLKSAFDKYISPTQLNVYSRFARNSDQFFRDTVFIQALKNGLDPETAAGVARKSLLDYGAPDKALLKLTSKLWMFFRFSYMMKIESVNHMSRAIAEGRPSLMTNFMRMNNAWMRDAQTWLYSDDNAKSRLFLDYAKDAGSKEKNMDAYTAGTSIPLAESFEAMLGMFSLGTRIIEGDAGIDEVSRRILQGQYAPAVQYVASMLEGSKYKGHVPDEYIWYMKQLDYDTRQELFDYFGIIPLKGTEEGRRRKGKALIDGDQWGFKSSKHQRKFKAWRSVLTVLGAERNIREYGQAAWRIMEKDPDVQMKAGGTGVPSALKYLIGASTQLTAKTPEEKSTIEMLRAYRKLKDEISLEEK